MHNIALLKQKASKQASKQAHRCYSHTVWPHCRSVVQESQQCAATYLLGYVLDELYNGNQSNVQQSHEKKLVALRLQVLAYHEAIREDLRAAALSNWLSVPTPSEQPKVLVCTDRTSRGIDSMWCEHVVLFEFPRDPSEYVRRVGRTARGAGGRGVVTVLVLGKQVALAKSVLERSRSGAPVHRIPRVWESER